MNKASLVTMVDDSGEEDERREYASPACFVHETDPVYSGLSAVTVTGQRENIIRWRKVERARLIALRLAITAQERADRALRIATRLEALFPALAGCAISLYWPFRGEPDLRDWADRISTGGAICALPVVVEMNAPLVFRTWRPGEPLARGVWNIPVPAGGAEVIPDVVIAPVVGFDHQGYRLGYGGGFFDRTLAAFVRKPRVIGVGYDEASIPTIYPLPHDVPMDTIVTPEAIIQRAAD